MASDSPCGIFDISKISQGESEDTTGRIRSHISKISQGESEAIYLRYHR
jgi:hypothetical protein